MQKILDDLLLQHERLFILAKAAKTKQEHEALCKIWQSLWFPISDLFCEVKMPAILEEYAKICREQEKELKNGRRSSMKTFELTIVSTHEIQADDEVTARLIFERADHLIDIHTKTGETLSAVRVII